MATEEKWVSLSRQDWSFHRRGPIDEARHNEKVKEAIKHNLDSIISDGSIITADPKSKKTIKIPLRTVEIPHIRYKQGNQGIGSGSGSEQPGDIIGKEPGKAKGGGAGDQPGVEYYETELTIEEIQALVFADLGLPRLQPRKAQQIESEEVVFDDIRKKRTTNNLDLMRTATQNMTRNAQESGEAVLRDISPEDYRVRTWRQEIREENSAVVIAMADISGSMGEFEKYITRAFCWWAVEFLRSKYPKVIIIFIAHDTEAYEVNEEQFFSRGNGGGTKCSSANELALQVIKNRYPPDWYNIYPLHFSDGDNWMGDNEVCIALVNEMLNCQINQYAYIQIGSESVSRLLSDYMHAIHDDRFSGLMINDKDGVLPALKQVFDPNK